MAFKSIIVYMRQMIWPADLVPLYPYPSEVGLGSLTYLFSVLLTILITALCIRLYKSKRIFSAIWAYYLVTLLPILGIIQVGWQPMADRYTYLPSIGPFLLLGLGFSHVFWKTGSLRNCIITYRILFVSIFAIWIAALFFLTVRQIGCWHDGTTVWSRVITVSPTFGLAFFYRANAERERGDYQESLKDFTESIRIAKLKNKETHGLYAERADTYYDMGNYVEALNDYTKAIKLAGFPVSEYYHKRGDAYRMLGHYDEAANDYAQAEKIR